MHIAYLELLSRDNDANVDLVILVFWSPFLDVKFGCDENTVLMIALGDVWRKSTKINNTNK